MFGSYGRLLFPVEDAYYSGDTLEELQLTYYSHIDPDETVEIVNTLRERAADGQTIFYDIYTDEEIVSGNHLPEKMTGLFYQTSGAVFCRRPIMPAQTAALSSGGRFW